jgi:hypothetical protein
LHVLGRNDAPGGRHDALRPGDGLPAPGDSEHARGEWRVHEPSAKRRIVHRTLAIHHVVEQAAAPDGCKRGKAPKGHARALLNHIETGGIH